MKLYVYMILCGSTCTFLYLVLDCIPWWELPLIYKRIFLRINIAFYLLPVPWLVSEIRESGKYFLAKVGVIPPEGNIPGIMELNNPWENYLFYDETNKLIQISGYKRLLPVILAGVIVYVVWGSICLIWYWRVCSRYKKEAQFLDRSKYIDNVRLRNKVYVAASFRISSPVVIGIRKPLILLPANQERYEKGMEGVIRHELRHIEGKDIMVRMLLTIIRAMEWFNPFVYFLIKEEMKVSEMICDEAAVKDMTKNEKADYMRCVLESAQTQKSQKVTAAYLGTSKKQLTERMERIMDNDKRRKTWKKGLAAIAMAVCFIICVIPAYAYHPPMKVTLFEGNAETEAKGEENNWIVFTAEGEGMELSLDFSNGDSLFVNEEGVVYPVNKAQQASVNGCGHIYETGTASSHYKNSDGGCRVVTYNAQRCVLCGDMIIGSKISETQYVVCPH